MIENRFVFLLVTPEIKVVLPMSGRLQSNFAPPIDEDITQHSYRMRQQSISRVIYISLRPRLLNALYFTSGYIMLVDTS